jgi:hypothetical protein
MSNETIIRNIGLNLLKAKGFRYLRYAHCRSFLLKCSSQVRSVGVCGAGHGFAELALALEFPEIEFTLTDIVCPERPNYWVVMERSMQWGVKNIRFGVWDALKPAPCQFDCVVNTEVLEHIKDARLAMKNMRKAARKAFYCLTPFATTEQNSDVTRRMNAYIKHGHFVCGFDEEFFRGSLGTEVQTFGAYWHELGMKLRTQLAEMALPDVEKDFAHLVSQAEKDILESRPEPNACLAIKAMLL